MAVKETSDKFLIFELIDSDLVILKYHTDHCGLPCQRLKPVYEKLSDTKKYRDVAFLRINADENPAALKVIEAKKQPVMNIYYKGALLECRTVKNRARMIDMLDKLMNYVPTA